MIPIECIEIVRMEARTGKIPAIKALRTATGWGLYESKEAVEADPVCAEIFSAASAWEATQKARVACATSRAHLLEVAAMRLRRGEDAREMVRHALELLDADAKGEEADMAALRLENATLKARLAALETA